MLLMCVGVNSVMGATLAGAVGGSPAVGAVAGNAIALLAGQFMPAGSLHSGVFTEIWTGEMIKAFRTAAESLGWYDRIRSYDQYVENDVIHFTELGGDPKVLVNNNTYPLNITKLDDADKPISLDKFDTEATPVTDDELHACSYDKMASVQERHREALKEKVREKAIHAIAPDAHSAGKTIVLRTTGEVDATTQRKRLTPDDIISLKEQFDAMGMPASDRVLVLCSEHANDLCVSTRASKTPTISTTPRAKSRACTALIFTSTTVRRTIPARATKRASVSPLLVPTAMPLLRSMCQA